VTFARAPVTGDQWRHTRNVVKSLNKRIIIGSDRRPETKQGIEEKLIGSDREGLGIIDRRSEANNFGAC